jgi:hypothetical protein
VFERELMYTGHSDTSSTRNHKWEELDEHLQVSIVTGLIENEYRGASNYLIDRPDPQQITWTILFRAKTRKEMFKRLPVEWLIDPSSDDNVNNKENSDATHIVAGIVYGAEAYCVLSWELDGEEEDQDVREEARESLADLANKLAKSLVNGHDIFDFVEQFDKDEKQRLANMKCRFYADLQSSPVRQFGFFDAYFHLLKLIRKIQIDNIPQLGPTCNALHQAVPISVLLCPLKLRPKMKYDKIINTDQDNSSITCHYNLQLPIILEELCEYRDIDIDIANRCCRIWAQLEQLVFKVDDIWRAAVKTISRAPFRSFLSAVNEFKELLRWSLKKGVLMARESTNSTDEEVKRVLDIAEGHQIFQPYQLEKWIRYKQSELEVTEMISAVKEINFVPSKKLMEKKLAVVLDKKFSLVLFVPSLDEQSNHILRMMQDYLENNTSLLEINRQGNDGDDDTLPWHVVPSKRTDIFDNIRLLIDHVRRNKHLENQVQFLITIDDNENQDCRYSVYEGVTLVKGNLRQLPEPPTRLRIHPESGRGNSRISVAWDCDDLGYPFRFLIEHRSNHPHVICNSWTQDKTYINFQKGWLLGVRVAVETCIGRSDFTKVLDSEIPVDDCDMKLSQEFKCLEMMENSACSRGIFPESIIISPKGRIENSAYEEDDDDTSLTGATTDFFWDCLEL